MVTLKVRSDTPIHKLAGAIVIHIRNGENVELSTIGPQALQRGIKACVSARRFLKDDEEKSDLTIQPDIKDLVFDESSDRKGRISVVLHIYRTAFDKERVVSDHPSSNGQQTD